MTAATCCPEVGGGEVVGVDPTVRARRLSWRGPCVNYVSTFAELVGIIPVDCQISRLGIRFSHLCVGWAVKFLKGVSVPTRHVAGIV